MRLYNVRFITSTEIVERQYPATDMQACLDLAVAHFATWNADYGELHEVVVQPPDGETYLDGDPNILEFYWVTPEGKRQIRELALAVAARKPGGAA